MQQHKRHVLDLRQLAKLAAGLDRVDDDGVVAGRVVNAHTGNVLHHHWLQLQLSDVLRDVLLGWLVVLRRNEQHLVALEWEQHLQLSEQIDLGGRDQNRKVEVGPVTVVRGDPDLSAHEMDQLLRNRQSQTSTTELTRGGTISLAERVENHTQLVFLDTNTGVAHTELQKQLVGVVDYPRRLLDADSDLSVARELDSVQLLLNGLHGQCFESTENSASQREIDFLNGHAVRFDLGNIQNVVNDGQQRVGKVMHNRQHLPLVLRQLRLERQLSHTNDTVHRRSNLVGRVGQELRLGAVSKLGSLSGSSVSLNGLSQVQHHLVNLGLQGIHFSRGLHGNESREVSVRSGSSDLGKRSHLRGQVRSHDVDVGGDFFPKPVNVVNLGLHTQFTVNTHILGHSGDFLGENLQRVHHLINVGSDFGGQVTFGDRSGDVGDVSHLSGEVQSHGVDVVGEFEPNTRHILDSSLSTQTSLDSCFSSHPRDFEGELPQLVHHLVDSVLQLQDLALGENVGFPRQISSCNGRGDLGDFSHLVCQVQGHCVDIVDERAPNARGLDFQRLDLATKFTVSDLCG
ncbi:hypothetical protein OGAPHI_003874 [Ogataea philodendri]|uniref:Uncharacterized protein n=1 Tax=Ogataea philodendri TaxID=1378263 RepID=A0A9P8T4G0_9ASCO|nr:uncharacterized protein OGAPHI_003874 [Ogataea philodendri]KAH3665686.1 hypothetical protein OGAPHI_003874 [Ogataea philodendri]